MTNDEFQKLVGDVQLDDDTKELFAKWRAMSEMNEVIFNCLVAAALSEYETVRDFSRSTGFDHNKSVQMVLGATAKMVFYLASIMVDEPYNGLPDFNDATTGALLEKMVEYRANHAELHGKCQVTHGIKTVFNKINEYERSITKRS